MKLFKQLFLTVLFTFCVISAVSLHTQAAPAIQAGTNASQIEPRSDEFEWRYTLIGGKLYRRLWNRTQGKWIGDWELCP